MVRYTSTETDDGYYACRIAFEMRDVFLGCLQHIIRNYLTLVILETPILSHFLYAYALMRDFTLDSPAVALLWCRCNHIDQVVLT